MNGIRILVSILSALVLATFSQGADTNQTNEYINDHEVVTMNELQDHEIMGQVSINPDNMNTIIWLQGGREWSIANIVGAVSDSIWFNDEYEVGSYLNGSEVYTIYGMNSNYGTYRGNKAIETGVGSMDVILNHNNEPINPYKVNDLNTENAIIAINSDWNVQPREVVEVDLNDVESTVLKLEQYDYSPGNYEYDNLKKVYDVDLDGDGSNELVILESNIDESNFLDENQKITRYSKLILLSIRDEGVLKLSAFDESFETDEYWYLMYSGFNFLDLNGDGSMEIIVESFGYEESLLYVFEFLGESLDEVLICFYGV